MAFSTRPEILTLAALQAALAEHGYLVSQKSRVLDVVEAAAANPDATLTKGPSIGAQIIPALRSAAGPLGPHHPWLERGDWDYAFKAHFDFVVHAPLSDRHATQPLFAVEFDGPRHNDPETQLRDVRKNRLCLASGLPLIRLDPTYLYERDRLSVIEWLATLWASYRKRMPELLADRDAEVAVMDPDELDSAGAFLLGDRPDLDVDLVFRLENPFPPAERLAERLAERNGFACTMLGARPAYPLWVASRMEEALPTLSGRLAETWTSGLTMTGPNGQAPNVSALVQLRTGYPIDLGTEPQDGWEAFAAGRVPWLPAGPWFGACGVLGPALCHYNLLREVALIV
ncbi:MAG: DUF2726 domain-containing protein [Acidimicrobiales bacterium]